MYLDQTDLAQDGQQLSWASIVAVASPRLAKAGRVPSSHSYHLQCILASFHDFLPLTHSKQSLIETVFSSISCRFTLFLTAAPGKLQPTISTASTTVDAAGNILSSAVYVFNAPCDLSHLRDVNLAGTTLHFSSAVDVQRSQIGRCKADIYQSSVAFPFLGSKTC